MQPLHQTINARRQALNLSYQDVYKALSRVKWSAGVKPPSLTVVGHWFNGTRRPRNMEHLRELCRILDMSIDEATGGNSTQAQTATEQALLSEVRGLDDAQVQLLIAMARQLKR